MALVKTTQGLAFASESGESILNAASKNGLQFPYSCRIGRCSSCKCKVVSGESHALHEELALSEQEKTEGWILSCVRSATTDMTLEVEELSCVTLPQVKMLPCRIHTLEKMAQDVIKVVLRLPLSGDFDFLPGQHIDVIGQGGIRRSYSLATASAAEMLLELHIRAVPGGAMSEYWFGAARIKDLLRLNGPLSTFFLRNVAGLDLIFLATGTGIAPVKSMLESIATLPVEQRPRSVGVYWGGRTPEDLYWDVKNVSGTHQYVPVLSRANDDWSGARGYVQHILISDTPDLSDAVVYACGSDTMIHSAKELLINSGLPEGRFLSDAFVCSAST